MEPNMIFSTSEREEWRAWLSKNFDQANEIWFMFPNKAAGEASLSYNDVVEEALCFGWIDSTIKKLDVAHRVQRFTPRRKGSGYSRANIERLIWLNSQNLLHPKVSESVRELINKPYVFPKDIIEKLKVDTTVWENYVSMPIVYQRIRIAYIDDARQRPSEFEKRLTNFINKTKENKMIGYGGIDKYYKL